MANIEGYGSRIMAVVLGGLLAIGCGDSGNDATSESDTVQPKVFVSFSGGGYHAQTAAASWMMSAMDYLRQDDNDLGDVLANAPAVSSNSGGSWFLTQAAYSNKFIASLEAPDAWQTYTTPDGYMGQAWEYLDSQSVNCDTWLLARSLCEWLLGQPGAPFVKFLLTGGLHWDGLVRTAVFGDGTFRTLDMAEELKNTPLSATRNAWSEDKALIIAGSILTEQPALTGKLAGLESTFQTVTGAQAGGGLPTLRGAAPIMLGAMGASGRIAPSFLTAGEMSLHYADYGSRLSLPAKLSASTSARNLNVMHAAAISSAAGAAFIDITVMADIIRKSVPAMEGLAPYVTLLLDDFAPAYRMNATPIEYVRDVSSIAPQPDALPLLLAQKINRTADGGFVDNTAVAYMLRHMQDNGDLVDGFEVVFFDDMPTGLLPLPDSSDTFPTAGDVAALFGYPDPSQDTRESCLFEPLCLTTMSPHVFESDAYFETEGGVTRATTQATWSNEDDLPGDCAIHLRYVRYDVTTVANPLFGITHAGVQGVLHVFVAASSDTSVVPASHKNFECYETMVSTIHHEVTRPSDPGVLSLGDHLADALGLPGIDP